MSTESQQQLDDRARQLRAEGLSYRQIAEVMGERLRMAQRRVNRERENERARAYKAANRERVREADRERNDRIRGKCLRCDGLMGRGTASGGICRNCRRSAAQARVEVVVQRWSEGRTLKEIATELNTTPATIGSTIQRARTRGYDLPRRPPGGLKARK